MQQPSESPPPARESQGPAAPPAPERLEGLLLGLARIFAIVPLYPAAHTRSREVGERFLTELRTALPGTGVLAVEVHRDGLRVHGHDVHLGLPQIGRIQHDLAALGVARVEIAASASPEDLHRFATVILEARRRVGSARGFGQLELDSLPDSTRVVQREFGRRGADAFREDRVRDAVDRVLEGTDSERPDDAARASLRTALERMFGGVVETLSSRQAAPANGQPFARSLDAVLDLGVHALRHAIDEISASGGDASELRTIFDATEKALAISDDRVSVEILLSVLAQAARELPHEKPPPDADATSYTLSIDELRIQFAGYGGETPPLPRVERGDRREEISILLHVLVANPADAVRDGITVRLGSLLEKPLDPPERTLLVEALRDLGTRSEDAELDLVMPVLTRALRSARDRRLLASIWRELTTSVTHPMLDALWPHLVNDLLLGLPSDPETRHELLRSVACRVDANRAHKLECLTRLEAVSFQRFAANLFDPAPAELFPIFADLLARDGGRLGECVLQGLRRNPPRWPGAEALWVFPGFTPACRGFLYALLREGALQHASPSLEQLARRTLACGLEALTRAGVGADWAPGGIEALGAIGDPEDRRLLREIRRGFRLWPWRRWPAACREAAARALREAAGSTLDAPANDAPCQIATADRRPPDA